MTAHKLAEEEGNQLGREKHTSPQPYTKNNPQWNKPGNGRHVPPQRRIQYLVDQC